MCMGFGCLVDKELNLYFSEPDSTGNCSHSQTLYRLDWKENDDQCLRHFVRVQFSDWMPDSFEFDEGKTLPGWCENEREAIRQGCVALLGRCAPAWAEYEKVCDQARAEYQKVRAMAWAEYEKVRGPALVEYYKVRAPALVEFNKMCALAYAAMTATLSRIPGYVAAKGNCHEK